MVKTVKCQQGHGVNSAIKYLVGVYTNILAGAIKTGPTHTLLSRNSFPSDWDPFHQGGMMKEGEPKEKP